jgi:hypothetical protein
MTVVLRGIGTVCRNGQLGYEPEPSPRRTALPYGALLTERLLATADQRPVIEHGTVEFRIGTRRACQLVEVKPDLPATPIRATAEALDEARRRRVEKNRTPAKTKALNRLRDIVADAGQ